MPCFSRIQTKITDHTRLAAALRALGIPVTSETELAVAARGILFNRRTKGEGFQVQGDTDRLAEISRKYAEIGVRDFARRRGFSIVENDGREMRLVNRRA